MSIKKRNASFKRKNFWDVLGGPVVSNPAANAGDTGLIPCRGRFCMSESNWACAARLLSLRTLACALQQEESLQPEIHAQQEGPSAAKKSQLTKK